MPKRPAANFVDLSERLIRTLLTGIAITGIAWLAWPRTLQSARAVLGTEVFLLAVAFTGPVIYHIYRVLAWCVIDFPLCWLGGLLGGPGQSERRQLPKLLRWLEWNVFDTAPAALISRSTEPDHKWYENAFALASFFKARYPDEWEGTALSKNCSEYLFMRWGTLHFVMITGLGLVVAASCHSEYSWIASHAVPVRIVGISLVAFSLLQMWLLFKVEAHLFGSKLAEFTIPQSYPNPNRRIPTLLRNRRTTVGCHGHSPSRLR